MIEYWVTIIGFWAREYKKTYWCPAGCLRVDKLIHKHWLTQFVLLSQTYWWETNNCTWLSCYFRFNICSCIVSITSIVVVLSYEFTNSHTASWAPEHFFVFLGSESFQSGVGGWVFKNKENSIIFFFYTLPLVWMNPM